MDVNQLISRIITHTSWDWRCICGGAQNSRSVHYLCPRSAILKCKPAEYCLKPYVFAMLLVNPKECQKKKAFRKCQAYRRSQR